MSLKNSFESFVEFFSASSKDDNEKDVNLHDDGTLSNDDNIEFMKDNLLNIHQKIESIYLDFVSKNKINISDSLKKSIKMLILEKEEGNKDIQVQQIKKIFNIDDNMLVYYVNIVKFEKLYEKAIDMILAINQLVSEDDSVIVHFSEEIGEIEILYQQMINIVNNLSEVDVIRSRNNYSYNNSKKDDGPIYDKELEINSNFIIYLGGVEDKRSNTINTKSGKGVVSLSNIVKEITLLSKSDYRLLRQKGKVHQIQERSKGQSGAVITSESLAYERIGTGTSKVGYIRLPIIQENMELLKRYYHNSNLKYLVLVIDFGDFTNEGISEKTLYDNFKVSANKDMDEIEKIIKIFKMPFDSESFEIVKSIIEDGISVSKSLSDSPMKSLTVKSRVQ